jgi:branched-chain amino acid transport system substrate-binding protein
MKENVVRCIAIVFGTLAIVSAVHAKDIVVGQSTALTGTLASSGEPMRLGAQVAFDAVNAAGGVNGRHVRFISKDDKYKIEETVRLVKELAEKEDAIVFVGGSGTANHEELLKKKILQEANVAMIGPRTGGAALRDPFNPYMFHIRASFAEEVEKAIVYFRTIGFQKIGVVYQDDALGKDGLTAAKKVLLREKLEPAFLATFERGTLNVEPAVKAAVAAGAQAIILVTTTAPTSAFVKLFHEGGGTAQLMALSIVDAEAVIKSIGLKYAHGLAITTVFPSQSRTEIPIIKDYQADLKKFAPNAQPSIVSLEGYVAARVIIEALKKAGPNPTREKVMHSLETLTKTEIGGFRINFGPKSRVGSTYVDISMINKNGQVIR